MRDMEKENGEESPRPNAFPSKSTTGGNVSRRRASTVNVILEEKTKTKN